MGIRQGVWLDYGRKFAGMGRERKGENGAGRGGGKGEREVRERGGERERENGVK